MGEYSHLHRRNFRGRGKPYAGQSRIFPNHQYRQGRQAVQNTERLNRLKVLTQPESRKTDQPTENVIGENLAILRGDAQDRPNSRGVFEYGHFAFPFFPGLLATIRFTSFGLI